MFLTILSSMAEEESLSISRNEKWSVQHRFQNGTYVSSSFPYGYCRNDRGEIMLEPEEAEIVKYIFLPCYPEKVLVRLQICWNSRGFLSRMDVIGVMLRFVELLRMKNMWEMFCCRKRIQMYIFIGTKIMGKWNVIFFQITTYRLLVGKLLQKQMQSFDSELPKNGIVCGTGKYQKRYAFSGKVICGKCGSTCKRRIHSGNEIAWTCVAHIESAQNVL